MEKLSTEELLESYYPEDLNRMKKLKLIMKEKLQKGPKNVYIRDLSVKLHGKNVDYVLDQAEFILKFYASLEKAEESLNIEMPVINENGEDTSMKIEKSSPSETMLR